ncbi:unnamed protein product [Paramecium pentaurelia]|uniref:C3H1-type domain-containing protein n=1 Tax=Paramecium pentaurelia TaxID=43138 RepID=A0A8S1WIE8_9CILI|nr:unnamed protein product [Paramecium pentaurelia]
MQNSDNSDEYYSDDQQESPRFLYSFKEISLQNKTLLAEIRIICKNLIYVIGLAPTIAKEENILDNMAKSKNQLQFRAIHLIHLHMLPILHIEMNRKHQWQFQYTLYLKFMACERFPLYDRYVKASFGTTKYCTNFLKGQQCKIKDCVYLHQHPKDKESTQVIKKEEMNNSKWLFSYSQKIAQENFKKFYTKINYKNALQKSVFLNTQNILDRMIEDNIVDPIPEQPQPLQQQQTIEETQLIEIPVQQKPIDIEKRLEAIIQKMDGDSNSRFKFTNGNCPQDYEAIQQLKQSLLK